MEVSKHIEVQNDNCVHGANEKIIETPLSQVKYDDYAGFKQILEVDLPQDPESGPCTLVTIQALLSSPCSKQDCQS